MRTTPCLRRGFRLFLWFIAAALWVSASSNVSADQVEMQNGDRYYGKVVSLDAETLVIKSDVLGSVRVPRAHVVQITLGAVPQPKPLPAAPANSKAASPAAISGTNRAPDLTGMRSLLSTNSNLIQQVQSQFLAGAGPEAQNKFNELLGGFLSGTLTINDIRAQAQAASDQIKTVRKDLDNEGGLLLDGYLAILDRFLKETASEPGVTSPAPKPATKTKPDPTPEE